MHHRNTLLLFLMAVVPAVGAQPIWTLEKCLDVARQRSLRLQAADNLVRMTALSGDEAAAGGLPRVKIAGTAVISPDRGSIGYDPAITDGGQVSAQIVVEQSLYDGGLRGLRSEQNAVEHTQRSTEFRMAERDLATSVRIAYVEAVRSLAEADLQREGLDRLAEYLALIRRLAFSGSATKTDELRTQIQLSNARVALQRAEESARLAEYALADAMYVPSDSSLAVAGPLEGLIAGVVEDTLDRPDGPPGSIEVTLGELELSRSGFDVTLSERERRPVFSLFGDAGLLTSGDNIRVPVALRSPMFGYSFGVSMEVPLFNGGATSLRVQQRQLATENLRLASEDLRRSLALEWKRLRLQMRNAELRRAAAKQNILVAEDNFLLIRSKFAGGQALSLEVLEAQQLLTDSKLAELQAQAEIQNLRSRAVQLRTQ